MMSARLLLPPLFLAVALCGCASRHGDSKKIMTTAEANRDSLGGAVQAPLRDVNVVRTKIPPILLDSMHDPYERPAQVDCANLVVLIAPLDEALGVDLDIIPPREDEDLIERGKDAASDGALSLLASAASDMIPFRGWVRKLSGAERHDRLVQSAVAAGAVRRAYLKGLGEARGCNPPATPSHVKSAVEREEPRKGPKYPVR
jgi:hypothetical protein